MHWVRYLIPIWESINISVKSPPENNKACTPRWIHFVATFPEAKLAWPSYFAPLSCTHIHGFFVARCLRWLHAQMKGPLPPLSPTGKIFLEVEPNFRDILLAGYQIWLPLICMHIWEIQNILISAGGYSESASVSHCQLRSENFHFSPAFSFMNRRPWN